MSRLQTVVFRSVKSRMTDFLSPPKSKFNGRFPPLDGCFITATEVFTATALTILLKYSYKYRRTLMGFMICCHQLHVSWCMAAIMQMPTFKKPVFTRGLRRRLYLPFPWIIIIAGWVIMISMTAFRIWMIRKQREDGGWKRVRVFCWVLSSLV